MSTGCNLNSKMLYKKMFTDKNQNGVGYVMELFQNMTVI